MISALAGDATLLDYMKPTIAQLVDRFALASARHHEFSLGGNWRLANREVARIRSAFRQLVKEGVPGREALLSLLNSQTASVAAMAAAYSLGYNAEQSLPILAQIAKEPGLIGFEAEQAIQRWNGGEWHLE